MTTTEIPEEIMQEAAKVLDDASLAPTDKITTEIIARSLMARDQRAADIAEKACNKIGVGTIGFIVSERILTYSAKEGQPS